MFDPTVLRFRSNLVVICFQLVLLIGLCHVNFGQQKAFFSYVDDCFCCILMVNRRKKKIGISPLLEANIKEPKKLQVLDSKDISRRNTMLYLTTGFLGGINILHGEAAEARVGRKENRKKAMEKLRAKAKESEPNKSGNQKIEKELEKEEVFPLLPPPLVVEANMFQ